MSESFLAKIADRAELLDGWIAHLNDPYADESLSRRSETGAESGWDPNPKKCPCECRREWMWGKLCLACDNTGWRPLTRQERKEGAGVDPYSVGVRGGVQVNEDPSDAARRARSFERLDRQLEELERLERIRHGDEAVEDAVMVKARRASRRARRGTAGRLRIGLELLRTGIFDRIPLEVQRDFGLLDEDGLPRSSLYYDVLRRDPQALRALATIMWFTPECKGYIRSVEDAIGRRAA